MSTSEDRKVDPLDQAELERLVHTSGLLWSITSGSMIVPSPVAPTTERTGLTLRRASMRPSEPERPSLVDPRVVWLVVEHFAPDEEIATMWFAADRTTGHTLARRLAHETATVFLESCLRRIAWEATISLHTALGPSYDRVLVGRGAWEEAARQSMGQGVCAACPYRLGTNLDCPTCRGWQLARKSQSAIWDLPYLRDGLLALDFDPEVAEEAAAAAERALAGVDAPLLTHAFFQAWTTAFNTGTAAVFVNEHDRDVARDLLEAQMLAPWFALPPRQTPPPRGLDIPPERTEAELKAEARRMLRDWMASGMPRAEAEQRLRTVKIFRKLFLAQAELYGSNARVVGGLADLRLLLEHDGRPALLVAQTAFGPRTEAAPDLAESDRRRLSDRLEHVNQRLLHAAKIEHIAMRVDHEGRSIDRALANLRRSLDHYQAESGDR